MSLSDRAVIFLVSALLASATLGTAGIVEQNNVFKNQIFEYRVQQIANDIDAMMYSEKGWAEKKLASKSDVIIENSGSGKQLTVDRNQVDEFSVKLDSNPSSSTIEDVSKLCIEKTSGTATTPSSYLVDVEGGSC